MLNMDVLILYDSTDAKLSLSITMILQSVKSQATGH